MCVGSCEDKHRTLGRSCRDSRPHQNDFVLRHEIIPHQLHLQQLNPLISLDGTRFKIATEQIPYPRNDKFPRIAGVSSFGFGGTNAHVIIKEAPVVKDVEIQPVSAPYVLTLSARSEEALKDLAGAYEAFLSNTASPLADIVFTAARRRTHHDKRLAIIGSTSLELSEKLMAFSCNEDHPDVAYGQMLPSGERGLAFVFSGQGPQWAGMGSELMETESVFREKIHEIDGLLKKYVNWSLVDELTVSGENSRLAETEVAQPAIFGIQVSLATLWKSWGVEPEAVVGHSVGEIAAAHVAGILSLEDAVCIVYHRSRLMQRTAGKGKMAAIGLSREQTDELLKTYDRLSIGALNSPQSTVLSGDAEALEEIVASLTAKGIFARMLSVNYAFHSHIMDELTDELTDALKGITPQPAILSIYSTVRGTRAEEGDYGPKYWARNIRQPVLFGQAIKALSDNGFNTFVEIGPHPVLLESINQCLTSGAGQLVLPTLRRNQSERGVILRSLGALFTSGYPVRWEQLYPHGHLVDLPAYPWQNKSYWLPNYRPAKHDTDTFTSKTTSASAQDMNEWFYDIQWKLLPRKSDEMEPGISGSWLILADESGVGLELAKELQKQGHVCRVVLADGTTDERAWLTSVQSPHGIINLRALAAKNPTDDAACLSVLGSMQALTGYQGVGSPRLWVITQGVQQVGAETVSPDVAAQALVWGLGRTISLEHPEIFGGLLDLASASNSELAQAIVDEVTMPNGEDQVAVREGKRFGIRLERAARTSSPGVNFSAKGAYLITGGLGGLGQHLARWLVNHGAKQIILTSRTGLPERSEWATIDPHSSVGQKIATVRQLETVGAGITIVAADVADEAQMNTVFDMFGKTLPPLKGVIHAAGVATTQMLSTMNAELLRPILKSKVAGAWLLHRLTQNLELDFFVLFSSSAAILGSSGLGHYGAANHFLDTLARIRHGLNLPALSINWGWWAGDGLTTAELEQQFKQIGQEAMPVETALQTLDMLMGSNIPQRMVASIDWDRFNPIYEAKRSRPLIEQMKTDGMQQAQPSHPFVEQLLSIPAGQRYDKLQTHLRNQVAKVLGFSASDKLDPQQGFFTIGMDSVMAVQLRMLLEASLGQTLPSTIAFEYPTIETLTKYLANEILKLDSSPAHAIADNASIPAHQAETQKALNEDELLAMLDDELAAFKKIADGE